MLVLLVLVIESSIMIVSCRPNEGNHNHRHHKHQREDSKVAPAAYTDTANADDEEQEFSDLTPMELAGIAKCNSDEDLMELCMRCVKATKANNVYPMCCLNEDGVQDWCQEFVYFGIQ